ncbi:hypothetical protein A5692_21900 [Mycobacterium sp. E342]|uniref:hypothetical protein n=1 Tax=Mycobacterium sp. E342 TaxID=1834147 RepID=UPI000801BC44|nr:hypothetical protein [Mycobacterium sp. E342]OBH29006.1 hypothetical protein A5692_21900 [Mycobacterium sp. E342]
MRFLRASMIVVGIIQLGIGAMYLAAPAAVVVMLGVAPGAPPWVNFVLATAGARFIGYGIGMVAAARSPGRHHLWIDTMIAIQLIDVIATLFYLANGTLPREHHELAVALPLLWVVLLGWASLRVRRASPTPTANTASRS